jgi:hypothetical protein
VDEEEEAMLACHLGVDCNGGGESASTPPQGPALQLDAVAQEASRLSASSPAWKPCALSVKGPGAGRGL